MILCTAIIHPRRIRIDKEIRGKIMHLRYHSQFCEILKLITLKEF
jgi:hypothetical protein